MEFAGISSGQRVTVCGLGDTGLSLARFAAHAGAQVTVVDTRAAPPRLEQLNALVPAAQFRQFSPGNIFDHAIDTVLLSPGISIHSPAISRARASGIPVAGDIEVFAQLIPSNVNVIAITGSNGKTTTTALVGALCAASSRRTLVAGNIGTPVLDAYELIRSDGAWPDVIVLELSSFQLESTAHLRCRAGAVLNISDDHLDRYPSLLDYAYTKSALFAQSALQVFNRDDAMSAAMRRHDRDAASFGLGEPADNQYGMRDKWLARGGEMLIPAEALRLVGKHNWMNALAALALVSPIGLDPSLTLGALADFKGLPHRMERIASHNAIDYIDDSKGTNVGATVAALEGLGRPAVLIAGGEGKDQDFSPMRNAVDRHARAVVLIGKDGPRIAEVLAGSSIPIERCDTLPVAVRHATLHAQPGDAVLLSPACASYDMFRNYEHRSEVFAQAVREVVNG